MNSFKNNKVIVLLTIVLSFSLFIDNVKAITFEGGKFLDYNNYFKVTNYNGSSTNIKYVARTNKKVYAYCARRQGHFKYNSDNYSEVMAWRKAKQCKYYVDGSLKENGDCSSIMGFIINESLSYFSGVREEQRWMYTQGAVWTYLSYFTPKAYSAYNFVNYSWEKTNPKIKTVFNRAWKAYHASVNGNPMSNETIESVNFSISPSDVTFNFVSNGADCNATGNYITKEITITNNESKNIKVTIFKRDGSKICPSGGSCAAGDVTTTIKPGSDNSYKFYLSTGADKKLGKNGLNPLEIKAEFSEGLTSTATSYDTNLYKAYDKNGVEVEDSQRILVMTNEESTSTYSRKHEEIKKVTLHQNYITHKVCSVSEETKYRNLGYNGSNSTTNPVNKVCAANLTASERANSDNKDRYTASFYDCTCTSVKIDGKGSIGILLTERVSFRFGNLETNNIYPGGGFGLDSKKLTTKYTAKIIWDYANVDSAGKPYYYGDDKDGHTVSVNSSDEVQIRTKIKTYLNGLKSNKKLTVDTLDSNNQSKGRVTSTLAVSFNTADADSGDLDSYDESKKMFTVKDEAIVMNNAYFSSKGDVTYTANKKGYSIDGGNKYYIPLNYDGDNFPYNIKVNNMSLTGLFNFYYKADCGIGVDDYEYGVFYRSIDVEKPFVKTNNVASSVNWSEWWNDNSANQGRIKTTFNDYPNNPLYEVVIDDEIINKYINYDKSYTSWSTVKENGDDTFLSLENGFVKTAKGGGNGSYCEIGKFDASCDK